MEKGNITIQSTRKGFAASLSYKNPNGDVKTMPITNFKFENTYYQGNCEFEREQGHITKLIAHDGTVLIDKSPVSNHPPASRSNPVHAFQDSMKDILHLQNTNLPIDVVELSEYIKDIDNYALKLNKAAYFSGKEKYEFYQQREQRFCKYNFHNLPISDMAKRHKHNAKQVSTHVHEAVFMPDWRLVMGLGIESVYETSITLHHVYGIPYIPGSSFKGVVRSWILSNVFLPKILEDKQDKKRAEKAEALAWKNEEFIAWFGSPKKAGKICFFDVLPLDIPVIEPDVMTPHYQDYYDGKGLPVDYLKTNPIPFLTVRNCRFEFLVGSNKEALLHQSEIEGKTLAVWIKEALEDHGIGAKTAVGYGYMKSE